MAEAAGGVKKEETVLQAEATAGIQQGESTIPLLQLVQQLLRFVCTFQGRIVMNYVFNFFLIKTTTATGNLSTLISFELIHFIMFSRNTCSQTIQQLQDLSRDPVTKLQEIPDPDSEPSSTSLDLLLRFQRLLVAKLFPLEQSKEKAIASDPGKSPLLPLKRYTSLCQRTHD